MLTPADAASTTISALLDNGRRLGLFPIYRTGTVFADAETPGRAMVTLDNDIAPVPAFNYAGPLAASQRVITIMIPPHGLYILGAVNASPIPTVETFTVTGTATYTKTSGLVYARVQVQAGGGAGGGANATAAGQWSFGDGGGGGEYAEGLFLASQIGSTETVTVGRGGLGSTGAGTVGLNSSFGSLITCVGGGLGSVRPASSTANFSQNTATRNGGSGGAGGTTRVAGNPGGLGFAINSAGTGVRAGDGGSSFLAGGYVESLNGAGSPGRTYGGGGPGVANSASMSAVAAMAGGNGIVIVTSYFA